MGGYRKQPRNVFCELALDTLSMLRNQKRMVSFVHLLLYITLRVYLLGPELKIVFHR